MNTHPYVIRLPQMIADLPDLADTLLAEDSTMGEIETAQARIGLAQAIVLRLGSNVVTPIALADPDLGVATTQKELRSLSDQGYQTAFSREAVAIHALDLLYQAEKITHEDVIEYTTGRKDPGDLITEVLAEHEFTVIDADPENRYYLCPHF